MIDTPTRAPDESPARGPLAGLRVVEFAGIGPAPFCAMLLSDMGAEVLRIERPGSPPSAREVTARGRRALALDLKTPDGLDTCLRALDAADVLIEGFRPGVMERVGLGPEVVLGRNPRLVYGRMTGWGQTGPLAQTAGHDINYIALSGALYAMGPEAGPPRPPLNLLGDYGGGALYLAFGLLAALFERERSGRGQVVDAAIVDGAASLMSIMAWFEADGLGRARPGGNFLDGSAPFYRCYVCADSEHVTVGALEPQFFAVLLDTLGLTGEFGERQWDRSAWPAMTQRFAEVFRTRARSEWSELAADTDACLAPVLSLEEARSHPHMAARNSFVREFGVDQPAPAPRFSRTPGTVQGPPDVSARGGLDLLRAWGIT